MSNFTLTVLGSGGYIPSLKRGSPAYWLTAGDTNILLDCGSGTLHQILRAGKDYKDLDIIVISHLHPDHMTDFFQLFQLLNRSYERKNPLTIIGSRDTITFIKQAQKDIHGLFPRPESYQLTLFDKEKTIVNGINIVTYKGNHLPSSVLTKITYDTKTFVYTGDTRYDESIIPFITDVDTLLTECTKPPGNKEQKHLNTETVGMLAAKSNVKQLIVSHFEPAMEKLDIKLEISKFYSGKIIVGEDLKVIVI